MLVLMVPKEMKVEHTAGVQDLTDEQLDTVREMLEKRTAAAQTIRREGGRGEGVAGAGRHWSMA